MKRVFLDTETTALSPGNITQLSLIIENEDNTVEAKNYFFDVDYITKGAEEVTGRGVDFYKEASKGKRFKDYKDEIYKLLEGSTLIGHNITFDENFISTEFWRQGMIFKPSATFDTMSYFKELVHIVKDNGQLKNPKLSELVAHFCIKEDKVIKYAKHLFGEQSNGFHDSMFDTTAMYVAFCIHRDDLNKVKSEWREQFC